MGHDHAHHHHGHHHGPHTVKHFWWCHRRLGCFCEINRYLLAMASGVFFAGVVLWLSRTYAGSYGAEGDAVHILTDALYMLVSALLALWRRFFKQHSGEVEMIGVAANVAFLFLAALYIIYHALSGEYRVFSAGWMAVSGLIGLIGNLAQFRILEEETGHLSEEEKKRHISMLSITKLHVFYDLLNSVGVILVAAIAGLLSNPRYLDQGLALLIATSMIWSTFQNARRFYRLHTH